MPHYIVKEGGRYAIFSTVVMSEISGNYTTLGRLAEAEADARQIMQHMSAGDLRALQSMERVGENDYWYDGDSERLRLAPPTEDEVGSMLAEVHERLERCIENAKLLPPRAHAKQLMIALQSELFLLRHLQ